MASLIGKALRNATPVPMAPTRPPSMIVSYLTSGLSGDEEAWLRAYATQGTVHANVSLLASSTAKPEWRLYRKQKTDGRVRYSTSDQGSDQRQEVLKHQALNVLNRPAVVMAGGRELIAWTRFSLFEISGIWLETTGKAPWVVEFDPRLSFPVGLWPVRPDRIRAVPDPENYLKGWVYTAPDGSEKIPLQPHELIMNRYPNPLDPYDGLGPVQTVLTEIEGNRYAGEWNRNFFLNSARSDGVLSADHRIEDDEWDEITGRWREAHRGVGRAHRIAVLEGVTWVPTSTSVKDMDFVNLRADSRDAIRESMGMHKVMTGVTDDVNRANAQTGEEVFANWKIAPRLDRWRDVLNTQFLPLFYPSAAAVDVEFDYIYPLPQNREEDRQELVAKAQAAQFLVDSGYDQHDVLEIVGLPDMKTVMQLTDQPALPPRWTVPPPEPGAPAAAEPARMPAAADGPPPGLAARQRVTISARKDPQAKVIAQLAEDYPPEAMAWAHHAQWSGPVKLPADHFEPDMKWMDLADPKHVADFTAEIRAGKKLKPVVAVKTPSGTKPKLVDGHHRYLADVQENKPVRAWIGTVTSDYGPWQTMHNHQIDRPAPGEPGGAMAARLVKVLGNGHQPVQTEALRDFGLAGRH